MPKTTALPTEPGYAWTELPSSAAGIAGACPPEAREQLQLLLKGVALTGCVWRSELRAALKGVAHYSNWLTVTGLYRDMFTEHGVESAIPTFVLRQFTACNGALPKESEAELERDAGVKGLQLRTISASMAPVDLEEAAIFRRQARKAHHHQVCVGLVERFYRHLKAGVASPVAAPVSDIVRSFADRCVDACKEVAAMYPEDIIPAAGSPEQSAFAMARRTAKNIEDRIRALIPL